MSLKNAVTIKATTQYPITIGRLGFLECNKLIACEIKPKKTTNVSIAIMILRSSEMGSPSETTRMKIKITKRIQIKILIKTLLIQSILNFPLHAVKTLYYRVSILLFYSNMHNLQHQRNLFQLYQLSDLLPNLLHHLAPRSILSYFLVLQLHRLLFVQFDKM